MKKISFLTIIDVFFKFVLLFMLNIIWTLYFIKTPWLCIALSIALSIIYMVIYSKIIRHKHNKKEPYLQEEEHIKNVTRTFIYMSKTEILNFFYKLFSIKYECKKLDDFVLVKSASSVLVCPHFKMEDMSIDDLIQIYNKAKEQNYERLIIVCNNYSSKILSCINNFEKQIIVLDNKATYYNFLKEYKFYPLVTIKDAPKPKTTFKQILCTAFNKKKTKGYVLSALFMLLASVFVVYKIYYLIIASVLLIFAILSRLNFNFNRVEKTQLID